VPVLVARGLRVTRGGQAILRGVDVEARRGEVLGVLGPSGAGKSTLFRALVGEAAPDEGTVLLAGRDVTSQPLWRHARAGMGYVPQGPSVLWDLTVRANLEAFQAVAGVGPSDARVAAARVGLEDRLDVRAGELSGGERRRLEMARAITRRPTVLVCDEPFAGVDPAAAERLGRLLSEMAAEGAAVLLADHHVGEALRVCTRALLLLDGVVAASAPAAEFPDHPLVRGRYLGTWTGDGPPVLPHPPTTPPPTPEAAAIATGTVDPSAGPGRGAR
jgi:lipopolysaccharide export system ATP-binding protein